MEKIFTIKSLDKDLAANVSALSFGNKEIIFIWKDLFWVYKFSGSLCLPIKSEIDRPIYGSCTSPSSWIVSRDVKVILDYLDKQEEITV